MNSLRIDPQSLDFDLPENLIAQNPPALRDQARLMTIDRASGEIRHHVFSDLVGFLRAGDALVLNNARVNQAQLTGWKKTGGKVGLILVEELEGRIWKALVRPELKDGTSFTVGERTTVEVIGRTETGEYRLRFQGEDPRELMKNQGRVPLPPYIKRSEEDARAASDARDYQTVYASRPGSIAAPTAGLHFTGELLDRLKKQGVEIVDVLLHVGWGTFRPIAKDIDAHKMLPEKFEVSAEALQKLAAAKREKRRIIAVGTTTTRVLESLESGMTLPRHRETNLFITPGFQFRWVDALITNFHVPRSTPIALTAAFLGLDKLERAYAEAIREKYRFFSYGDAMLII